MRISNLAPVLIVGLALSCGPASAFEGSQTPGSQSVAPGPTLALDGTPVPRNAPISPVEAFRSGAEAYRVGEKTKAISSLQYAAENGHALAQWKLGRMYADGDGVQQDDLRAFQYFSRIANSHAADSPDTQQARFVANAFVALGGYYLDGIPNSQIKPDPMRAQEMFSYAASYFGDPDAQYQLARLYLNGNGAPRDPKLAARWFGLAANKGQYQAQAMLGAMLFKGDHVPRQAAQGLMWLTMARDAATTNEESWIADLYDAAFSQATDEERGVALRLLETRLKNRRE
jgi:TPR repeat protein